MAVRTVLIAATFILLSTIQDGSHAMVNNEVIGVPRVKCEDHRVAMELTMAKPFTGRIFVKGMADRSECAKDFRGAKDSTVVYELRNGDCNMNKQRRIGPQRGIEQSMTVVVSFHDTFITKMDRAYRCTCFFMEAEKAVTSDFEVSDLATTDLIDTARTPSCTYRVRHGSINGPAVSHASVGDQVYHVWQCDSDTFGMLVHSCKVDDGTGGRRIALHDESGCAVDAAIVGELTYNQLTNQAFVVNEVFKFADKQNVYFQCAISLCMKSDGACHGLTPPQCSDRTDDSKHGRARRGVTDRLRSNVTGRRSGTELDVSADGITVSDLTEESAAGEGPTVVDSLIDDTDTADSSSSDRLGEVCLSHASLGAMLTTIAILLIVTLGIVAAQLCVRTTTWTPKE
uniref:ZP domain-containing protein n=1 Tax=Trichuris muris TaxID=70415 RepID=A0A5S6Q6X9_TRIMR